MRKGAMNFPTFCATSGTMLGNATSAQRFQAFLFCIVSSDTTRVDLGRVCSEVEQCIPHVIFVSIYSTRTKISHKRKRDRLSFPFFERSKCFSRCFRWAYLRNFRDSFLGTVKTSKEYINAAMRKKKKFHCSRYFFRVHPLIKLGAFPMCNNLCEIN